MRKVGHDACKLFAANQALHIQPAAALHLLEEGHKQ